MYTVFDASEAFFRVKMDVEGLAPLLVKHGIDAVNPPAEILENHGQAGAAAEIVFGNGLKWGILPMPADFLHPAITDAEFDEGIEKLKVWAETGGRIGVKYAYNPVFPGHDKYVYDQNYEWHIIKINRISSVLKDCGIRYGIEFLGPPDLRGRSGTLLYTPPAERFRSYRILKTI